MTETKIEYIEAAPLTSENTKHEILDHLLNVHGITMVRNNRIYSSGGKLDCKTVKSDLLLMHARQHELLEKVDETDVTAAKNGELFRSYADGRYVGSIRRPKVDHTHPSVVGDDGGASAEEIRMAAAARAGERISDKPLNSTQIRNLEKLINADFEGVEQDCRVIASDALAARKDEIKAEWADRRAAETEHLDAVRKIERKARRKIEKIVAEAKDAGVTITNAGWRYFEPRSEFEGFQRALSGAEKDNREMLERALMRVRRERTIAIRRVYLSGVSSEAAEVLNTIPSAEQMVREAGLREAQGVKELESSES